MQAMKSMRAMRAMRPICAVVLLAHGWVAAAEEDAFRHAAPVVVEQAGAYVRLPLPVSAYANSRQPGLGDLRVVDARGERIPYALLAPRPGEAHTAEATRAAALYALPPRKPGDAALASPLQVQVVGDRITVRRFDAGARAAGPAAAVPGWLFDLGERVRDEPPPTSLRLAWAGAAPFSAAFDIAVSDDLRQWRSAGGGQILALDAAGGRLTQPQVMLPAATMATTATTATAVTKPTARFVRLVWADPANAPLLTAALQVRSTYSSVVLDAPTALVLQPVPEPAAAPALVGKPVGRPATQASQEGPGALHYDLGAVLPLVDIELQLAAAQRVAPVRIQGRARADEPWRDLAQTVFYRLERGSSVDRPPPLPLQASVRYLRLVPDARSGALAPAPLAVRAQLLNLVFAAQGTPPYRLLTGSAEAPPGALPVATLVPALDAERARFGRASLGAWSENEALARAQAWRERLAAWRPALLWGVLLIGVAALGAMVWRLARKGAG
jgi:hypothetical protein